MIIAAQVREEIQTLGQAVEGLRHALDQTHEEQTYAIDRMQTTLSDIKRLLHELDRKVNALSPTD